MSVHTLKSSLSGAIALALIALTSGSVDAVLPGESSARPVSATGMVSVPRRSGALSTVAYLHGTSVSFYDAVSNPAIAGGFSENGESFDGPPSNAIWIQAMPRAVLWFRSFE